MYSKNCSHSFEIKHEKDKGVLEIVFEFMFFPEIPRNNNEL